VCVGAQDWLTGETARIGPESSPDRSTLRAQSLAVEEEPRRSLGRHINLQSGRIAIVISRMSCRSSSIVGRPQNQYPL
jgi:hypothetical protein